MRKEIKNSTERCLEALQEVYKEIVIEGNHKIALSNIARKNKLQSTFGPKLIDNKIVTKKGNGKFSSYFWNVDVIPNIKMAEKLDGIMRQINNNNTKKRRKFEPITEEIAVDFLLSKGYKVFKQVVQWEELK